MSELYNTAVPGVIVRGMTLPETCNDCRFSVWRPRLGAEGYIIQCQAMEEGDDDEIGAEECRRCRLSNCPLEELPEEIHTDCRIDLGPVWIRADEDLPNDDRYVLCCTSDLKGNKNIMRGYYDGAHCRWVNGRNTNVTHWMELPVPPGEVKSDE